MDENENYVSSAAFEEKEEHLYSDNKEEAMQNIQAEDDGENTADAEASYTNEQWNGGVSTAQINQNTETDMPQINQEYMTSAPQMNQTAGMNMPQMNQTAGMSAPQNQPMGMSAPQMNRGYGQLPQVGMAPRMPAVNPANQKSRLVVLLLAIFVGGWGVHNFYIGENEKGIIKVIITIVCDILLFITGIILPILNLVFMLPVFGVHIWAIIEGICVMTGQVKTDAKGIPFKD